LTKDALTQCNVVLATAMLAMLPVAVVVFMQRRFVQGLVETEKSGFAAMPLAVASPDAGPDANRWTSCSSSSMD
jgi:hypothetical protein